MKKRNKPSLRPFTLLEIMLGLCLLIMASSLVGWNLYRATQKKHFYTDVSKIRSQLQTCHRLALNTQLDWKCEIASQKDQLLIRSLPLHDCPIRIKPTQTRSLLLSFEGKEIEQMVLYISPTGKIEPEGIFLCQSLSGSFQQAFSTYELFNQRELKPKQ